MDSVNLMTILRRLSEAEIQVLQTLTSTSALNDSLLLQARNASIVESFLTTVHGKEFVKFREEELRRLAKIPGIDKSAQTDEVEPKVPSQSSSTLTVNLQSQTLTSTSSTETETESSNASPTPATLTPAPAGPSSFRSKGSGDVIFNGYVGPVPVPVKVKKEPRTESVVCGYEFDEQPINLTVGEGCDVDKIRKNAAVVRQVEKIAAQQGSRFRQESEDNSEDKQGDELRKDSKKVEKKKGVMRSSVKLERHSNGYGSENSYVSESEIMDDDSEKQASGGTGCNEKSSSSNIEASTKINGIKGKASKIKRIAQIDLAEGAEEFPSKKSRKKKQDKQPADAVEKSDPKKRGGRPKMDDPQERPFVCEPCGNKYLTKNGLVWHMKKKHDLNLNGTSSQSNGSPTIAVKEYDCVNCGRKFRGSQELSRHKITEKCYVKKYASCKGDVKPVINHQSLPAAAKSQATPAMPTPLLAEQTSQTKVLVPKPDLVAPENIPKTEYKCFVSECSRDKKETNNVQSDQKNGEKRGWKSIDHVVNNLSIRKASSNPSKEAVSFPEQVLF